MKIQRMSSRLGRSMTLVLLAAALPLGPACGTSPPTAPDAIEVDPPQDPGDTTAIRSGTFSGLSSYTASGGVRLRLVGDTAVIEFQSDFRSQQVPGPYVYLNTVTDVNQGQPIRIGALRSPTGSQVYSAIVRTDVTYQYVVVWCDPFNVGVAAAQLSP